MKFKIWYGLGGSFGGYESNEPEIIEATNKDMAIDYVRQCAIDLYESYGNLHGLRTIEVIVNEEGLDIDNDIEEIMDIYNDEMEMWLDYDVEPIEEVVIIHKVGKVINKIRKI